MSTGKGMARRSFLAGAGGTMSLAGLGQGIQAATTPYQRPKVKITGINTAEVRVHGHQTHVRVYTDAGVTGHGEATDAAVGTAALVRSFKPILTGKDPLNVDALWEQIRVSGIFAGAQGGQYVTALSGVEIALWDLAGKLLGLPVYQLLGGKFRDRVRMYCDSDMTDPLAQEADKKKEWIAANGFTAMKIDIDEAKDPARFDRVNWTASNGEVDRMVNWVRHTRETIPKTMDLAVDMHGRYDATTGKRVAMEVEPFHLLWLEEPVPAENVDAMADIRHSTKTPICCGENLFLRWGYQQLLEKRAADIIMPDIQKTGGLSEARKIANLSQIYYVPFAPHCVVSPIGTMASAHVCAAVPNFLVCEWHWINELDLWKSFVKEGEIISGGHVLVTDRPGIGVAMNEQAARTVQIPGTPWFED